VQHAELPLSNTRGLDALSDDMRDLTARHTVSDPNPLEETFSRRERICDDEDRRIGSSGRRAPAAQTRTTLRVLLQRAEPPEANLRRWRRSEPALAQLTFRELRAELLDRAVPPTRKDDLLAALLRAGQTDTQARLAVVLCLLPGLQRLALSHRSALDPDDAWSELVAALLCRISRYDLNRRPERIAANLLLDSLAQFLTASRRQCRATATPIAELEDIAMAPAPDRSQPEMLAGDTLMRLAVDAGVLTDVDATLITATRLSGVQLTVAAGLCGLSYEAAKTRRQRAERAWVAWWTPELRRRTLIRRKGEG
jgi:DNA-directed RNA polymerase specialized sigma24 family protein